MEGIEDTEEVEAGAGVSVPGGGIGIMIDAIGIIETEIVTAIIAAMAEEVIGMTEMRAGKDMGLPGGAGALSGKAARNAGLGLSSGIERGRRSSEFFLLD